MPSSPPPWQAHDAANFDATMGVRCAALLSEIKGDQARRQAILADPRDLHRELFASFAPPGHGEYAGTYRGTAGTSLARRRISADCQFEPGEHYEFCAPEEVPARMDRLVLNTEELLQDPNADHFGRLIALTYTFCWFGKIHPFLDGNGHVQRAIFAAMATEFGYPLSPRFAIHPRPYDRLLATALEVFSRAPVGEENSELSLAAEYLAFFLDGPFSAVRKHVGSSSPYE
ncbi:Fic family protein [Sphingomonas beigongshangi]|uniref:Fic family protein n=1 Tax=Sphingomonas beigongshangi TaxID=2782540 RepID=UPI001AED389E|nr:Fic family protein [Sphingomonas beigongshangi]